MDNIYDLLGLLIFDTCDKIIFCNLDDNASETEFEDESDAKDHAYELDNGGWCLASIEIDAKRNAFIINYTAND